jgi:preprotein translocase subunit SecA
LKKGLAQTMKAVAGEVTARPDDPNITYFYYGGVEYKVDTAKWTEMLLAFKQFTDAEHDEVIKLGGLFIFGTERHEARRIDNQLRGRAGRQGDPGASRFYLSLEDDLMRIFAKEWVSNLLQRLGMLEGLDQKELILQDYVRDILGGLLDKYAGKETRPEDWDIKGLKNDLFTRFGVDIEKEGVDAEKLNRQELGDNIFEKLRERYDAKEGLIGAPAMRHHERIIMLSVLDQQWKDHLLSMDHLREGIGLRGYGQHDPLVEYKRESFDMFEAMMERFEEDTVRYLYLMQVIEAPQQRPAPARVTAGGDFTGETTGSFSTDQRGRAVTSMDDMEEAFQRRKRRELEQARMAGAGEAQAVQQVVRGEKVGRNDPCPCGSGKKYKKCCGA